MGRKNKDGKKVPRTAPKTRKAAAGAICLALAAALIAGCLFGVKAWKESRPLLVVAGYEVSREEYLRAMYEARDDVLSEHGANGVVLVRWDAETELGMPCEMAARRAVEILREYYAVTTLAVERGYLEDAGYEYLKARLEEENWQRAEAVAAGEIITGLTAYDPDQYIAYRAASLRRQFCDDDNNPEMQVTREDILRRYEEDKDSLYTMEDTLELHFIQIYTGNAEAPEALEAQVWAAAQLAEEKGSLGDAVGEMPGLQEYYRELTVDGGNYAAYARGYADVLAFSEELGTGDMSQVICRNGWIYLIQCAKRIENDYVPLEDVASVVERSIRESRYDALVTELARQLEVTYDPQTLYRFTAEQLG